MTYVKRAIRPLLVLLAVALAYGYWAWPTPWRHWSLQQAVRSGDHIAHVTRSFRTNRLTGQVERVLPSVFARTDCHATSLAEVQTEYGPLTAAQVHNAERRW